jgi:3D (Asp-Asp-Asp) domain-containing protein
MEEEMSSSAKSTAPHTKRATTVRIPVLVLIATFLAYWSNDLTAIAQSAATAAATDSRLSISVADDIDKVSRAVEATRDVPAEPVSPVGQTQLAGSIAPQTIARTFSATAYCLKGKTASGVVVRRGIIAADPRVLPLGSIVRLQAGKYSGIYTVMDTGGAIRGRRIDIYLPTRSEAIAFGNRDVKVEVLRHGWEPDTGNAK